MLASLAKTRPRSAGFYIGGKVALKEDICENQDMLGDNWNPFTAGHLQSFHVGLEFYALATDLTHRQGKNFALEGIDHKLRLEPMENVVLTIHLIISLCLIGIVLVQRSEGGGLGIGGGGGGAMGGRPPTTPLGKLTWIVGIAFVITSLALTVISARNADGGSVLDGGGLLPPASESQDGDALLPPSGDALLPPSGDGALAPPRADQ